MKTEANKRVTFGDRVVAVLALLGCCLLVGLTAAAWCWAVLR
jgi:hypothetical protein